MSHNSVILSAAEMRLKTKAAQAQINATKEAEKQARFERLKEVFRRAIESHAKLGRFQATCEILDAEAADGVLDQVSDLLVEEGYHFRPGPRNVPYQQLFEISWS